MRLFYAAYLFFVPYIFTLKKENFRTCKDSSFCRRNRKLASEDRSSQFSLLANTLQYDADNKRIIGTLGHREKPVELQMEISAFNGGHFRVRVTEPKSIKPRYDAVKDIIIEKLPELDQEIKWESSGDEVKITWKESNSVDIRIFTPSFRVEVWQDGDAIAVLNQHGWMNWEEYRTKEEKTDSGSDVILLSSFRRRRKRR